MENQKRLVESRWKKAPKYFQGEMTHDAKFNRCVQRLTKGEGENIIMLIKRSVMVFIPSDGSWMVKFTHDFC